MANALRRTLRFTLISYERGLGPNAVPPCVRVGDLADPARALPVPFWRYSFAVEPATSPRVFVDAPPRRRAGRWALLPPPPPPLAPRPRRPPRPPARPALRPPVQRSVRPPARSALRPAPRP